MEDCDFPSILQVIWFFFTASERHSAISTHEAGPTHFSPRTDNDNRACSESFSLVMDDLKVDLLPALPRQDNMAFTLADHSDLIEFAKKRFDEMKEEEKDAEREKHNDRVHGKICAQSASGSSSHTKSRRLLSTLLYISVQMDNIEGLKEMLQYFDPTAYGQWSNLFDSLHPASFALQERAIQNQRTRRTYIRKIHYKEQYGQTKDSAAQGEKAARLSTDGLNATISKLSETLRRQLKNSEKIEASRDKLMAENAKLDQQLREKVNQVMVLDKEQQIERKKRQEESACVKALELTLESTRRDLKLVQTQVDQLKSDLETSARERYMIAETARRESVSANQLKDAAVVARKELKEKDEAFRTSIHDVKSAIALELRELRDSISSFTTSTSENDRDDAEEIKTVTEARKIQQEDFRKSEEIRTDYQMNNLSEKLGMVSCREVTATMDCDEGTEIFDQDFVEKKPPTLSIQNGGNEELESRASQLRTANDEGTKVVDKSNANDFEGERIAAPFMQCYEEDGDDLSKSSEVKSSESKVSPSENESGAKDVDRATIGQRKDSIESPREKTAKVGISEKCPDVARFNCSDDGELREGSDQTDLISEHVETNDSSKYRKAETIDEGSTAIQIVHSAINVALK